VKRKKRNKQDDEKSKIDPYQIAEEGAYAMLI
jgi:hypothetical protein